VRIIELALSNSHLNSI